MFFFHRGRGFDDVFRNKLIMMLNGRFAMTLDHLQKDSQILFKPRFIMTRLRIEKVIHQLYEGALLIDGNLNHTTDYVARMTELMVKATEG